LAERRGGRATLATPITTIARVVRTVSLAHATDAVSGVRGNDDRPHAVPVHLAAQLVNARFTLGLGEYRHRETRPVLGMCCFDGNRGSGRVRGELRNTAQEVYQVGRGRYGPRPASDRRAPQRGSYQLWVRKCDNEPAFTTHDVVNVEIKATVALGVFQQIGRASCRERV